MDGVERFEIPARFVQTMSEVYGELGRVWVEALPELLTVLQEDWQIAIGPPFAISYNFVAPAQRNDGSQAVLKVGYPAPEFAREAAALEYIDGDGAARLLAYDAARGAMLLERLLPGETLEESTDPGVATRIAARVMRGLWRTLPADGSFPTVAEWCRGFERLRDTFDGGTGPFPEELVRLAEGTWVRLEENSPGPMLLHGDLHHGNILASGDSWRAIDPKGIAGDPAFEVYAFLKNPISISELPDEALRALLAARLDVFASELGFERERLRQWGFVGAMLSGWWSYEDHGYGWEGAVRIAGLLAGM